MKLQYACASLLFILSQSIHAFSKTSQEQEFVDQARAAFNKKNYQQALNYYQQANRISPSYTQQYNIAVCYYKLNAWGEAYEAFKKLHTLEPDNERVHLNFALSAKKLGKHEEALAQFEYLSSFAESDTIAVLAYKHLKQVNQYRVNQNRKIKTDRFLLSAVFGAGSDNNVVTLTDEVATTESDNFLETTLSGGWYSTADFDNSVYIDASYYASRYLEIDEYDVDVVSAGAKKYLTINPNNRIHLGLRLDQSSIGGEDYLRSTYINTGYRRMLSSAESVNVSLRYQNSVSQDEIYDGLAGKAIRVSTEYKKQHQKNRLRLRYQYDTEDKNDGGGDETLDGDISFISYSANRHSVHADWSYESAKWSTRFYLNYRYSRYQDEHLFVDDTGGLREDKKSKIGAHFSYALSSSWHLGLDVSHIRNNSSLDIYHYDQNIFLVTLAWQS